MTPPFDDRDLSASFSLTGTKVGDEAPLVLIAEDQPMIRAATARNLERRGFRVLQAADGRIAMTLVAEHDFDIAIVNLGLPEISGFEIVSELKGRLGSAVSVLVMSGNIENDVKVRAFDAGADDYVPKPVYMPELVRRVTAFRRTQLALLEAKRAKERMEQLNLYASEAAALLAHDLANGLSVALGNLDYLQATTPPGDDDDRIDARSSTLRALRKMAGLVRNFVELRQLEDAALIPKPSRTSIRELVEGVAGLHRHEIVPRGAKISTDCPPEIDAMVNATLVERVVHNLVGNATRYVNQGGRILVKVSVEGDPDDGELVIQVGNTGASIPEHLRSALFEKYQTGGDKGSRRGMGLYFCRLASEAHGGAIEMLSTPEFATNFVVRIPTRVYLSSSIESEPVNVLTQGIAG